MLRRIGFDYAGADRSVRRRSALHREAPTTSRSCSDARARSGRTRRATPTASGRGRCSRSQSGHARPQFRAIGDARDPDGGRRGRHHRRGAAQRLGDRGRPEGMALLRLSALACAPRSVWAGRRGAGRGIGADAARRVAARCRQIATAVGAAAPARDRASRSTAPRRGASRRMGCYAAWVALHGDGATSRRLMHGARRGASLTLARRRQARARR